MFSPKIESEIRNLAVEAGYDPAALLAVADTEGKVVDMIDGVQDGLVHGFVMIRFEGHHFWKHLPKTKREKARRAGLAHPKMGAVKNSRSMKKRHEQLSRAMAIDEEAALKSISMGIGQVMGSNYAMCGYKSVFEMWHDCHSVIGQVRSMVGFIKSAHLDDELRDLRWAAFARGYNGPAYKRNRYDTKMAAAYKKYGGTREQKASVSDSYVRMGDHRASLVRQVQTRLQELGYPVKPDGDFGTTTRRYVMAFQAEHGLKPDGVVGPATKQKLYSVAIMHTVSEERQSITAGELAGQSRIASRGKTIQDLSTAGAVAVGTGKVAEETGALDVVLENVEPLSSAFYSLQPVLDFAKDHWWIIAIVGLIAVAYFGRGILQARLEDHRTGKTV